MLGKLLKYDLKWIYKVVGIFYILALVFSIIGRALSYIENSVVFSIVSAIFIGTAVAMIINCLINCLIRLWVRFIRNCYKDESYLTHTLPVEKKTIYLSKVISALITIFTTSIVIIICLLICYYSEENLQTLKTMLELAASTYNTTVINLLLLISTIISMQMLFIVLIGYVGIILGHKSNKYKIIISIIISFALYMLTQVVSLVFIYIFGLFNSNVMNLVNTTEMINIDAIKLLMYLAIGMYAIYIIVYYILGKKAFQKGVNVE